MTRTDLRDIARWAVAGAVFTFLVVGMKPAISQSEEAPRRMPSTQTQLSPFTFKLEQLPSNRVGQLKVRLSILSGSNKNETLKPILQLVSRQYTGSPGGRSALVSDYNDTGLASRNANAKVASGGTWTSDSEFNLPMKDGKLVLGTYALQLYFGNAKFLDLSVAVQQPVENKTKVDDPTPTNPIDQIRV